MFPLTASNANVITLTVNLTHMAELAIEAIIGYIYPGWNPKIIFNIKYRSLCIIVKNIIYIYIFKDLCVWGLKG